MKVKKQAIAGLVGEVARELAVQISGEIVLIDAYVGVALWFVGDFSLVKEKLSSLIRSVASELGKGGEKIIVKTGIMDAGLPCLRECLCQQDLGEGHYVFLEVTRARFESGLASKQESSQKRFYPFTTLKGFGGYCLASPGIRGIQGDQGIEEGLLHLVSSGRGEKTLLRMLIPIKEDFENESVACAI